MPTTQPIKNDDRIPVKDVHVSDFPVPVLERLRQVAEREGFGSSNGTVVRWAAMQHAKNLDAAKKAQR